MRQTLSTVLVVAITMGITTPAVIAQNGVKRIYTGGGDFLSLKDFINRVVGPVRSNQRGLAEDEVSFDLIDLSPRLARFVVRYCPSPNDNVNDYTEGHRNICQYLEARSAAVSEAVASGWNLAGKRSFLDRYIVEPDLWQLLVNGLVSGVNVGSDARKTICDAAFKNPFLDGPNPTPTNTPRDKAQGPIEPTPTNTPNVAHQDPTATNTPKTISTFMPTPMGFAPPAWSPSPVAIFLPNQPTYVHTVVALGGEGPQIVQTGQTVQDVLKIVDVEHEKAAELSKAVANAIRFIYGSDPADRIAQVARLRLDVNFPNALSGVQESLTIEVTSNSGYGSGGNPQNQCTNQHLPPCCSEVVDTVEAAIASEQSFYSSLDGATIGADGAIYVSGLTFGEPDQNHRRSATDAKGTALGTARSINVDPNLAWVPDLVQEQMIKLAPILKPNGRSPYKPTWLRNLEVDTVNSTGPLGDFTATPYFSSMFINYGAKKAFVLFSGTLFVQLDVTKGSACEIPEEKLKKETKAALENRFAKNDFKPLFGSTSRDQFNPFTIEGSAVKALGLISTKETCLAPFKAK